MRTDLSRISRQARCKRCGRRWAALRQADPGPGWLERAEENGGVNVGAIRSVQCPQLRVDADTMLVMSLGGKLAPRFGWWTHDGASDSSLDMAASLNVRLQVYPSHGHSENPVRTPTTWPFTPRFRADRQFQQSTLQQLQRRANRPMAMITEGWLTPRSSTC
jgi:hypothetical protein